MIADEPFQIDLRFRRDPLKDWDTARPLIELFATGPVALRPARFSGRWSNRREIAEQPFALDALARAFAHKHGVASLWLWYADGAAELGSLGGHRDPGGTLQASFPMELLARDRAAVIELIAAICRAAPPHIGYAEPDGDRSWSDLRRAAIEGAPVLEQPYWVMVLGKPMVEQLGKARVAEAPAFRVEMLKQGGAVIVATEDPFDLQSEPARNTMADVFAHLRPELDRATILRELHDRTAAIARERAAKAARVAAQPARAPSTDWCPLADAPACDVADPDDAIDDYDNDAERYVAGFHAEVEHLMQGDLESLEGIDDYFLAHDPWAKAGAARLKELLVPTLGAYLGRVLVGELDGQWVPMTDRQRAYVAIGDRAWLPFQRVARYLESRAATQQHSLATFFDDVARHSRQA